MDGRTRYNKIKKLLTPLVGRTIELSKLRARIMMDIGSSENVIIDSIHSMLDLGLIKEVKPYVYKVFRSEADI